LPLEIVNHKGRVASRDHFIVNALRIVDAIDDAASNVETSRLVPGAITGCDRLVLRQGVVPKDAILFRLRGRPEVMLLRRDVADRLVAAGFTGLRLIEPDRYTGLV